jgi:hypothetical protein
MYHDKYRIPTWMGIATAINFQPIEGGKAAVTGDFVLTRHEVNPVLRILGENGIDVTAIHGHMLDERPRMFFMHFWGVGNAKELATALHQALSRSKRK